MAYEIEFTNEFEEWWRDLSETEQDRISSTMGLLEERGPNLGHPQTSSIKSAKKHKHMRELRVQVGGHPLRILYAFDPRTTAILLLGGDKTGDDRWYEVNVPIAEKLYDEYLAELKDEGLI